MKRLFYPATVLLIIITTLSSCKVLSTAEYNAILANRDSLSLGWEAARFRIASLEEEVADLKADTARLNSRITDLQNQFGELEGRYKSLQSNTNSEISKLSADLQKREARLNEVEEILRRRDEATNALKNKLQEALLGFQQSGLSVDIRDGKVYVSLTDKLLFSSGSIVIDERGKMALTELAAVLRTQPEINISVEGHTDDQRVLNLGQIKDNWDLSVLRATSVVRYLTSVEGIDNTRITATGKGEYQPVEIGSTPDIRSMNRRIEIVLSPKLDELYNLIR
jgi:chemotaxis protein MotB